ncbi:PEP-CTERM sorting domain-containing protein [Nostoc sp. ChiQUE01b]|uniref:PEP-CTERM sorting domain-containing protein n=1 Tax=Nostoc sp. ChiQUE01b TaxID=3075376 RepID=UPI002AD29E6C|nr:PEP-CTERM sorting domain-containing protein [Nostoc sp. ChiQUE01b]MDZ8261852.1 PEP-CTERM sorting domain-containing protein [Nostoc sp. ChiQUE01b]
MISLKSKLVNATLAATFAIPLATAGMFTSAGSAQAAIIGSASFDGNLIFQNKTQDTPTTEVLKFDNPADVSFADGIFSGVTEVMVGNTDPYSLILNQLSVLSSTPGNASALYKVDMSSVVDPFLTFDNGIKFKATSISNITRRRQETTPGSYTTSIDTFSVLGTFYNGVNAVGDGSINALQKNTNNARPGRYEFQIDAISKSVPEPTTILGLGAVGAVVAMSRRRKTLAN